MTSKRGLNIVMMLGLLLSFAAANVVAQRIAGGGTQDLESSSFEGPPNVNILPPDPASHPEPTADDVVLLIGNSHTYALPSLDKGQPLQPDNGETLIYRLAEADGGHAAAGESTALYQRLAYPNFLPLEMWLTLANLREQGHSPDVIVLGLTFRNVARDFDARSEIAGIMADDSNAEAIRALAVSLDAPDVVLDSLDATAAATGSAIGHRDSASADVAVDATVAGGGPRPRRVPVAAVDQVAFDGADLAASRRGRRALAPTAAQANNGPSAVASIADEIDEEIREALDFVPLVGDSVQVRARVRRWAEPIWLRLLTGETGGTTYDIVDNDLDRNMEVMVSLADLMVMDDTRVIVYLAPQRTDLPPVIDRSAEQDVLDELRAVFEERGIEVLDASGAVPNEYWGYDGDFPDRSHFSSEGHRLLSEFLVQQTGGVEPHRSP